MSAGLVLRNVEIHGRGGLDLRIEDGRIAEIGPGLGGGGESLDGRGGALIPGLADHHIHLLALAAQADSVDLSEARGPDEVAARIAEAAGARPPGAWIRAIGYHEQIAGDLARADLDRMAPAHRLRVQHQTGSLWMLNSRAIEALGGGDYPACVERDGAGRPTGRIWRGDAWLRSRIGAQAPTLAPIGRRLAAQGVTHLTDASVTTDAVAAGLLAQAHRRGELPQRLTLMSGGPLTAPKDGAFTVGPLKVLLDDHALPELDDFIARIALAREFGRPVAVHCVTAGELAMTLAAFESAGAAVGDRIEHGGLIPAAAFDQIKAMGLAVVTQPAFVLERGDRYLAEVAAGEQVDLYRCASLIEAGVPVAASSDAPYASTDPWRGIEAAVHRRTASGQPIGPGEAVPASAALALYLDAPAAPGRVRRRVTVGEAADLCLLDAPLGRVLAEPGAERVAATIIGGEAAYLRGGA